MISASVSVSVSVSKSFNIVMTEFQVLLILATFKLIQIVTQ